MTNKTSFGFKPPTRAPRNIQRRNSAFEDSHDDRDGHPRKREHITSTDDLKSKFKRPKIVIPAQENTINFHSPLEEQAYKEILRNPIKYETNLVPTAITTSTVNLDITKAEAEQTSTSGLTCTTMIGRDADYSQVPVADFGMGMLLGMGWSKDRGIWKTFRQVTEVATVNIRPKGLGLGANLNDFKNCTAAAIGEHVKVTEGPKRGHKGVIIDMDVENVRVTIKTKNGRVFECSELAIKKHDKSDTDKDGKKKDYDKNKISHAPSTMPTRMELSAYERVHEPILVQDTRVRIIDKTHPGYKEKFWIKSVLTPYLALLETGQEFHQSKLESVIPKRRDSRVAIVSGKYKGCVGRLDERLKKEGKVIIDFWDNDTNHHVSKFGFDEVSEYMN